MQMNKNVFPDDSLKPILNRINLKYFIPQISYYSNINTYLGMARQFSFKNILSTFGKRFIYTNHQILTEYNNIDLMAGTTFVRIKFI